METLLNYFLGIGFDADRAKAIVSAFSRKDFSKNDLLVEYGKVSRTFGFIESGMLQYYVIKDGDERTTYVSLARTWFASIASLLGETPSLESVRAITDGAIFLIDKPGVRRLNNEVPGFKDFYLTLLERSICGIDASRHDLLVLSAEERYQKMLKEEPRLLQEIPLQYLASMLGVTPRHLSRIRGNIRS